MRVLASEDLLLDIAPQSDEHNLRASILRRGLVVSAFSTLETYLEARYDELLQQLATCSLKYNDFDDNIKSLLTKNALVGLLEQSKYLPTSDQIRRIEIALLKIATFSHPAPTYTPYGFSPKGSNINQSDISALFSSLGLSSSWSKLTAICRNIGATQPNLSETFLALSKNRNLAAHDSSWQITSNDLNDRLSEVVCIGIAFDVLLTSVIRIFAANADFSAAQSTLNGIAPTFRFVDEGIRAGWVERTQTAGNIRKRYASEEEAKRAIRPMLQDAFLITRDKQQKPIELD